MNRLRQRIPFEFSPDNEEEDKSARILDEQEQEEVIKNLRRENSYSVQHHYRFLQGCLSFTIMFFGWFLVSSRHMTPLHVFFPNVKTPLPDLIPFTAWFTFLDILTLLNVMLHLPKDLSFPRLLQSTVTNLTSRMPLEVREVARRHMPFSITWSACLLCIPLLISIFAVTDPPQILWWSLPPFVVGVVVLVKSWIAETEMEVDGLEKMKYEAKGA